MNIRFATLCLTLAAALLAGCQTAPVTAKWPLPEGVATLPAQGYPMAYQVKGSGSTVVLVPGVMCDYRCWWGQMDALSGQFRVVAVSLRHSYPEPWDGQGNGFSVAQHARDLASFIEAIGAPVHVVAQSYGAHVAYEMARARPELVRKLVLGEAPLDSLVAAPDAAANAVRQQRAEQTAAILRTGDTKGGMQFAVDSINGPGAWDRLGPLWQGRVAENSWTVVAIGRDDPPRVQCSEFGSLKMPVLLVTGADTTPRFRNLVQAQSRCLPQAQVVTVPKSGHGSPYQNPAAFNAAVSSFLR